MQSLEDLKSYVAVRMEEQRRHPNRGLIYSLMTAEVDGHRLSDEEVIANTIITLIGGHETTTNLIASGFLTLLRNPESLQQLRSFLRSLAPRLRNCCALSRPFSTPPALCPPICNLAERRSRKVEGGGGAGCCKSRSKSFPDPDRLDLLRQQTTGTWLLAGALILFRRTIGAHGGPDRLQHSLARLSVPSLLDIKHWNGGKMPGYEV